MDTRNSTITAINGIRVGNIQNLEALTGCTVILCEKGAVGGVDQRGGAPGTRETDLLRPMHLIEKIHAIVLTGGSAFGLDASTGVMKYLEENRVGVETGFGKVPIVSSAVLFDLGIGDRNIRPDAAMGYEACKIASKKPVIQGNIGAGTGATAGKLFGMAQAMKSGLGSSCIDIGNGIKVGALVAANPFGDIIDPNENCIIVGTRTVLKGSIKIGATPIFANTLETMKSFSGRTLLKFANQQNTVIGVVATNAKLSKDEVNKFAQMSQDGLARVISPAHTMFDGDTMFALSTGTKKGDVNIIGAWGAEMVAQAIISGVLAAKSAGNLPAANDI